LIYSIIIPAFNEAERLPATLDSVLAYLVARLWNAEIIVVNDGSTDGTAAVVQRYAAANSAVRWIENGTNRGKGHSIRRGVEEAAGEIVLFIDADNSTPIEDAQKLFHVGNLPVAVLTYGLGNIGRRSMESFVHEFSRAEAGRKTSVGQVGAVSPDDVGEIAKRFFDFMRAHYHGAFGQTEADKRPVWAFGMIGVVVGYWLK